MFFKTRRVIFFREIINGHEGHRSTSIYERVFYMFLKRTKENQTIINVDLNQE